MFKQEQKKIDLFHVQKEILNVQFKFVRCVKSQYLKNKNLNYMKYHYTQNNLVALLNI